jgi:hypothetical protein
MKPFKRMKELGNVDISKWTIYAAEEFEISFSRQFEQAVLNAANEALECAVGYDLHVNFKGLDGEEADPLPDHVTFEVVLPLAEEGEGPEWHVSLDDLVGDLVLMADTYMPGKLEFVRDRLRKLADDIDAAITP